MGRNIEPVGTDDNPPVRRQRQPLVPVASPAPAAAAVEPPAPAVVEAPAPVADETPAPAPDPAPVQTRTARRTEPAPAKDVRTPGPRRTSRAEAPRRDTRRAAVAPAMPEPPPGYVTSKKPLQVYVQGGDHWNLKFGALIRGTDMSAVVSALVSAFNHDPDTWVALINRAQEERTSLGELLEPALAAAFDEDTTA